MIQIVPEKVRQAANVPCQGCRTASRSVSNSSTPIETRAERDFLAAAGIDLMQGYWFSMPVFQGLGVIAESAWE